jgi:hypothetical protein
MYLNIGAVGRRELMNPRKQQSNRKSPDEQYQYEHSRPIGQFDDGQQIIEELQQHPGDDGVSRRNPEDMAAF